MVKLKSQIDPERKGRVALNVPQKNKSNKPFRVTRKTDNEEVGDDRTSPDHKVRLSSDLPHSTYIALCYSMDSGLNIVPADYAAKIIYEVCTQKDSGESYI